MPSTPVHSLARGSGVRLIGVTHSRGGRVLPARVRPPGMRTGMGWTLLIRPTHMASLTAGSQCLGELLGRFDQPLIQEVILGTTNGRLQLFHVALVPRQL